MSKLFIDHPILLLFVVASIGYLIGTIKIKGSSLGVAAVLFVGLSFGAMNPLFDIPDIVFSLGLVLFVYSIGLSSGAAFFQSYKRNGIRDFLFIVVMLILSGLIAVAMFFAFGFSADTITGIYAGSTTNTPALAGVIDYVNTVLQTGSEEQVKNLVVAYSFSYPMGVLGAIISILLMEKILKIDYDKEIEQLKHDYPVGKNLSSRTIRITNPEIIGSEIRDINNKYNFNVSYGRISKEGDLTLSSFKDKLDKGDLLVVVGSKEELDRIQDVLGEKSGTKLSYYRREYDSRRIFVSNPKVAGRTISSLNLDEKFGAIVTRIRRGDVDMLAKGNTVLELGDRIRFVARRKDLRALSTYFGDSYTQSSQVNLFSFGLGIGLGLLLGCIEVEIVNGVNFKLGYAGGLLIVALVLGALRRTGPIVWTLPYSANVTLQQIGLILLLAGIGVSSGNSFVESLSSDGLYLFIAGSIISLSTAILTLWIGYKCMKIPFSLLLGMVSNQPAILDFAKSKANSDIPMFGYTMMFPIALILKIVIAQILYLVLA